VFQAAAHPAAAMLREARGLLLGGWCRGAQARDGAGSGVAAWSEDARSWSVLGALLASWYLEQGAGLDTDVAAHSVDARALGDATAALGEVAGTASLEQWNDEPRRTLAEVTAAIDRAVETLERSLP
jgi:hypothetical protein